MMTTFRRIATVITGVKTHLRSRIWLDTEAWTTFRHNNNTTIINTNSSNGEWCPTRSNENCLNTNNRNKMLCNRSSRQVVTSHRRLKRSTLFPWIWTSHRVFLSTTFCLENFRYNWRNPQGWHAEFLLKIDLEFLLRKNQQDWSYNSVFLARCWKI